MNTLFTYAQELVERAQKTIVSGKFFAKVLTKNDDSGRHGVLIPSEAYPYFPDFHIPNPGVNATQEFSAFNTISRSDTSLAYKYYERYPERRVTRLDCALNNIECEQRILVFLHAMHSDGSSGYYFDCANSAKDGRFEELFNVIFGSELSPIPGNYVICPIESSAFSADPVLTELLGKFDKVKELGWIDTMRNGDTGIGYTFETLLGIKENNDQRADFMGIEIKCKSMKLGGGGKGKINIFQAGPVWDVTGDSKDRIRIFGKRGNEGLFSCHSQVTLSPNNLGLLLHIVNSDSKIDLRKEADQIGHWSFSRLEQRLAEKHSRTVFVKAETRTTKSKVQFFYKEVVYCDRPSIERFVELVSRRSIVFEFLMHEKPNGEIRNHGYPWRLIREEFMEQLFAFQIKVR